MAERRPGRIYGHGQEPDPRFSLANERTLLAWLRTALALVAAGVASVALSDLITPDWLVTASASVAFAGGAATALVGYSRWERTERALRARQPLPALLGSVATLFIILGLAAVGVAALIAGSS